MQDKNSVIFLSKGKEMIAFPGPGGYKVEWSPGTKLLPMTTAPSGHLVIPCDHFDKIPAQSSTAEQFSFVTDHTRQVTSETPAGTAADGLKRGNAIPATNAKNNTPRPPRKKHNK